jgi:hypothetical protein
MKRYSGAPGEEHNERFYVCSSQPTLSMDSYAESCLRPDGLEEAIELR